MNILEIVVISIFVILYFTAGFKFFDRIIDLSRHMMPRISYWWELVALILLSPVFIFLYAVILFMICIIVPLSYIDKAMSYVLGEVKSKISISIPNNLKGVWGNTQTRIKQSKVFNAKIKG